MDLKILLEKLSPANFPVGLGGCKNAGTTFDCCEYNITIFDDKVEEDSITRINPIKGRKKIPLKKQGFITSREKSNQR